MIRVLLSTITRIKILNAVAILLLSGVTFAQSHPIAVVREVKGNAFYSLGGETKVLTSGMHLPSRAEIFTEVGAKVSLNDYYDHILYLSGGVHLSLYQNLVELKEGYIWVKSLHYDPLKGTFKVTTVNSMIDHSVGEGIISFDSYSGKTQLLSLKGDFDLRNIRMENRYVRVREGQFSFIQKDYDGGTPRPSTPIGYASYKKVTSLFRGMDDLSPRELAPRRSRRIASVQSNPFEKELFEQENSLSLGSSQKGKITILKLKDPVEEKKKEESLLKNYQKKLHQLISFKKVKKEWRPHYGQRSGVKVSIFGVPKSREAKESRVHQTRGIMPQKKGGARLPASVIPSPLKVSPFQERASLKSREKKKYRTPASIGRMLPSLQSHGFEHEMVDQYKKKMRHEREVNALIDQLKSIDMDYKKDY